MVGCDITSSQCSEPLHFDLGTLFCEDPLRWGGGSFTGDPGGDPSINAPVIARDLAITLRAHNPKVGSSNLPPATKIRLLTGPRFRPFFIVCD